MESINKDDKEWLIKMNSLIYLLVMAVKNLSNHFNRKVLKCLERDLNTRPAGYESAALTS